MQDDSSAERPLFGGAIASTFPLRFQDVSNIRQVPDHQEAFVDPARDESLIFELLDLKPDVADNGSAAWFLGDLDTEQAAEGAVEVVIGELEMHTKGGGKMSVLDTCLVMYIESEKNLILSHLPGPRQVAEKLSLFLF